MSRVKMFAGVLLGAVVMLLLLACSSRDSDASWGPLEGYWEGAFMQESGMNLTLVLHFDSARGKESGARVLLWQDESQIQDDPLSWVRLSGDTLSFNIEAKNTPFQGLIDIGGGSISGSFLFPDGSVHQALIRKVVCPAYGDCQPMTIVDPLDHEYLPDELQEDLLFLHEELERLHPRPYLFTPKDSLDAAFAGAYHSLDTPLREDAFLRRLAPMVASVGCAHTTIQPSEAFSIAWAKHGSLLPLVVAVVDHRPYVISRANDTPVVEPGAELLSINGQASEVVLARMLSCVSAEGYNETYKLSQLNRNFALAYGRWIEQPDRFELQVRTRDDTEHRISVSAVPLQDIVALYKRIWPKEKEPRGLPVAYDYLADLKTGVLTVRAFHASDPEQFVAYLDGVFQRAPREGVERLVLDLRGNIGGHPFLVAELLSYLADTSFIYFARSDEAPLDFPALYAPISPKSARFNGPVYILVDGGCVSSAGHFLSLVRSHHWGTLIGEESGGSFYCHDNSIEIKLPTTGIRVNMPRRLYQTSVAGFEEGHGIEPDYRVSATLDDILNGTDAVMAYALQLIRESNTHMQ